MTIEVKNAEVIIKLVKEKLEQAKKNLAKAVEDEATRMVIRTRSGKDVDGQAFAPYTPAYNRFKGQFKSGIKTRTGKAGRNANKVRGAYSITPQPVDLTLSGNMLNAIDTKMEDTPTGAVATVFFSSALEAVKAQGNQKKRRFFGFSEEQVQRIKSKLFGT